jgi:hypothetical protein
MDMARMEQTKRKNDAEVSLAAEGGIGPLGGVTANNGGEKPLAKKTADSSTTTKITKAQCGANRVRNLFDLDDLGCLESSALLVDLSNAPMATATGEVDEEPVAKRVRLTVSRFDCNDVRKCTLTDRGDRQKRNFTKGQTGARKAFDEMVRTVETQARSLRFQS